jgi:hypothetical protein
MSEESTLKCPNCGTEIDVQQALSSQMESHIREKHQEELNKERASLKDWKQKLEEEREAFQKQKEKENDLFKDRLEKKLKEEKSKLTDELKHKLQEEQSDAFKLLRKELDEKSEKVKNLLKTQQEVEKLKREKEEIKEEMELKMQREMNERLQLERDKILSTEKEKKELEIKELKKQLDDQKKLTEEMKRKQEQGSMQLQGEVQELAIEEFLLANFPLDTVEEIKKGAYGADCVQYVNTRTAQNCGVICYESKRTKEFSPAWIDKFKQDLKRVNAQVGVLVTEAMPSGMDRMGQVDGIWVCSFSEFKGLCKVLRSMVIQVHSAFSSQENKGDKMELLYDFLTSNNFRMQIEGIVEGFSQMKIDLDKERRAMQRIWKQREKQIEKVVDNTIEMYGSIKGIAGSAVGNIKALELGDDLDILEH